MGSRFRYLMSLFTLLFVLANANTVIGEGVQYTFAVMDFTVLNSTSELKPYARGLTDLLATMLADKGRARVVERTRLDDILGELSLGVSGLVDEETAAKTGRLIDADYIVIGSLRLPEGTKGNSLFIDVRIVNSVSGRIAGVTSIIADRKQDLTDTAVSLCQKVEQLMTQHTISGYIHDASGRGISGVTVSFNKGFSSVESGFDGSWQKTGLFGSVVVTPVKTGWTFHPASVVVSANNDNLDFDGNQATVLIGGFDRESPIEGWLFPTMESRIYMSYSQIDGSTGKALHGLINNTPNTWNSMVIPVIKSARAEYNKLSLRFKGSGSGNVLMLSIEDARNEIFYFYFEDLSTDWTTLYFPFNGYSFCERGDGKLETPISGINIMRSSPSYGIDTFWIDDVRLEQ